MQNSTRKNALWLTATKFASLFFAMLTTMVLSRFRTLEEYGTYSQLLMVVTLITTIFSMGLPGSINYFLANEKDKKKRDTFYSNYFTIITIISFITGATLILLSQYIAEYFNNSLIMSFSYVLAFLPWIKITADSIDNVFIVQNKLKMLATYRIANSATTLVILVLTLLLNWNFNQYMSIFIGSQIFFTIVVYFFIGNMSDKFRPKLDRSLLKNIFKFSIPLGFASIIGILHIQTDLLMIGRMYNTETLAIYSNASREIPITIISVSIATVLLPQLVRLFGKNEKKKALELWKNATKLSYIILCFCVTELFIFAPQVIAILYSEKYLTGVPVFRVYVLLILLKVTYFGIVLNAVGKTRLIMISSIIALVLNVIFNLVLPMFFGIIGFAIATFLSTLIVLLMQLYFTAKEVAIPFSEVFPWGNVMLITVINAIMGIGTFIIYQILKIYLNIYIVIALTVTIIGLLYFIIMKKKMINCWKSLK